MTIFSNMKTVKNIWMQRPKRDWQNLEWLNEL